MKNKNEKCCAVSKMSGTNIFVGILIGLVVLIFGGKIFLSQTPVPQAGVINGTLIDKTLSKKNDNIKFDVIGTWMSEEGELILNKDGTVVSNLDITGWKMDDNILSMTFGGEGSNYVVDLTNGVLTLTSGETVLIYNKL